MRASDVTRALVAVGAAAGVLLGAAVVSIPPTPSASTAGTAGVPGAVEQGRPVPGVDAPQQTATPDPAQQSPEAVERQRAVQLLLDGWAEAVRADDRTALAQLMDPRADGAFAAAEQVRAAQLAGVPLADWGYEITAEAEPVVPPELATSLGADEVWAPPVVLRYAIAGADDSSTRKPVGLVVARRGSTWSLVTDTALGEAGRTTWRGPWDAAPVLVRSTPQGVVLGHPGQEVELDALAAELVDGVPAVTELWGTTWPQKALILLAGSQSELEMLVGADFAGAGVAAVTTADAVDLRAGTATGVRVVVNPATFAELSPIAVQVVVRHELTHVAARAVTADQAPLWMLEGFADYSGYRALPGVSLEQGAPSVARLLRAAGAPTSLPTDADFAPTRAGTSAELAYQLSWTFAEFLAATRGEDALLAAYRSVAAVPTPTPEQLDASLLATVGAPVDELVAQWGRWLVAEIG